MNEIILKGIIRNIKYSHTVNDVDYDQAELIVPKEDSKEDNIVNLKFKKFSNNYSEGNDVELVGNLRSYSKKVEGDHSKVSIYVFTYFDQPTESNEDGSPIINSVDIDGRICKKDELRTTKAGKQNLHFVIANNIINHSCNQKINNYIPCVALGKTAIELDKLNIGEKVYLVGKFNSRTFKKILPNGETEIRVAHELLVTDFEKVEEED